MQTNPQKFWPCEHIWRNCDNTYWAYHIQGVSADVDKPPVWNHCPQCGSQRPPEEKKMAEQKYCPHQEYISLLFHKDIPYEYDCPWCNPLTTQRPPSEEKDWLVEVIEKSIAGPFDGAITANAIRTHIEKEGSYEMKCDGFCCIKWRKFLGIRKDGSQ